MQPPKKSKDIPVTVEHLEAIETKLSGQLTTVFLKTGTNNEDIRHLNKRMDSLKSEISSKFAKVDFLFKEQGARIDKVENRMDALEHRMETLEQRMDRLEFEMKKGFDEIKQMIQSLKPSIHHQKALYEEQTSRNLYVLDGYVQIFDEQKRLRERLDRLEGNSITTKF